MPHAKQASSTSDPPSMGKDREAKVFDVSFHWLAFELSLFGLWYIAMDILMQTTELEHGTPQEHTIARIRTTALQCFAATVLSHWSLGSSLGVMANTFVWLVIYDTLELGLRVLNAGYHGFPININSLDSLPLHWILMLGIVLRILYVVADAIPIGGLAGWIWRDSVRAVCLVLRKIEVRCSMLEEWCLQVLLARRAEAHHKSDTTIEHE